MFREWWEIDEPDPYLRAEARMGAPKKKGMQEETDGLLGQRESEDCKTSPRED